LPIPVDQLLADVDIQDKDKLIESIQREQQAQQQQQQQMAQLQMQNQQIVNESLQSKAMSDRSLADERQGKLRLEQHQIATTHARAEHEKAAATYNAAKAAKEIESMGVDDFVKIINLIENISNRQDENQINQEVKYGTQP
jgi:hypothetical protein